MDADRADSEKLGKLIEHIKVALLTTFDAEGQLHTRPLETLQYEANGTLWFFTDSHSPKSAELQRDVRVSLGYADPAKHIYVAITGVGSVMRDEAKAAELWTPGQRAWYPQGPTDERLALLRVHIEHAEYWFAPGRASYALAAARAAITGTPATVLGENRKMR